MHKRFSSSHNNHANLAIIATYFSTITVMVIIILKFFGWLKTDSVTLLASLTDSLLDGVSSVINLLAIKYALQPPDDDHRFGHNKAEDLAGFIQAAFFSVSALFLIANCIYRIAKPQYINHSATGINLMIISTFMTLILVIFQRYVLNKTSSTIVEADHLHYCVDLLSNLVVIISIWTSKYFDNQYIDPFLALLVAIYMINESLKLLKKSFKNLMDQEFDEIEKSKIHDIVNSHLEVLSMHDLKTRCAGSKPFIQFHLVMDGNISLFKAHDIAEEIETELIKIFPDAEMIIHQDPERSTLGS